MFVPATNLPSALIHGFSDRHGGVSEGAFATLNLGGGGGDAAAAVAENRRRLAAAADFDLAALRLLRQVHGAVVVRARELGDDEREGEREGDALWARRGDPPVVVGVLTADCVPILVADAEATAWAAIHAGWRGVVAGVVGATIAALQADGVAPASLRAAIGPCIEVGAFEVGPEVALHFPAECRRLGPRGREHVDLPAMVRRQLIAAGVESTAIARVGGCTMSQPERYYSYRRDGRHSGRLMAFIGARPAAEG